MECDMGILEALTLIFVVLKLMSIIDWSWFWVLSPLIFALLFYTALFFGLASWASKKPRKRK